MGGGGWRTGGWRWMAVCQVGGWVHSLFAGFEFEFDRCPILGGFVLNLTRRIKQTAHAHSIHTAVEHGVGVFRGGG